VGFPNRLYESLFKPLRQTGDRITIHSGEAGGPENMWEALELLGAQRIGHGIAAACDPRLVEELVRRKLCLEVCPVSNWLTSCVPSLESHPLPKLLRAGVSATINTDDPTVFGTSLPNELKVARTILGLTEAEISRCMDEARRCSFLGLT
jgi:adenosine deaminase